MPDIPDHLIEMARAECVAAGVPFPLSVFFYYAGAHVGSSGWLYIVRRP